MELKNISKKVLKKREKVTISKLEEGMVPDSKTKEKNMKLIIEVSGDTHDDLVEALNLVAKQVEEEYLEGYDRKETCRYEYKITRDES